MHTLTRATFVVGVALALCAARAGADSVFLRNGTRLTGDVRTARGEVTIKTEDGVLTLPSWRVAHIRSGAAQETPSHRIQRKPAPAASGQVRAPRAPSEPAEAQPGGPPRVRDVLATKMDVDFGGMSLDDALMYVREVTGVNMALSPEVRADSDPIYLHLKQVRLATVLDLILKPRGFGYTIRPGEVLYVRAGGAGDMVARVYRVTDLLTSTEDRGVGQAGAGRQGSPTGGRSGAGLSPQYAGTSRNAMTVSGGRGGQYGGTASSISSRAENLVFMIKGSCGYGTWMDPTSSGLIDVAGTARGQGQRSVGGAGY